MRFHWPTREEALGRLDRGTGIRHRPATALSDTLATQDPVAQALWQAQRERTLASIRRIRAGLPSPRLAIHDPWALRALSWSCWSRPMVAAGDERTMRVASAFDWNGVLAPANIRVDAWVTPPVYTGKPPIILSSANKESAAPEAGPLPVPAGSTVIVRSSGGSLDVGGGRRCDGSCSSRAGAEGHQRAAFHRQERRHRACPRALRSAAMEVQCHAGPRADDFARQGSGTYRPAARCRCPTRSRTITASLKPARSSRPAPARCRRLPPSLGPCSIRRNFRWCCRMRGRATASARPSRT